MFNDIKYKERMGTYSTLTLDDLTYFIFWNTGISSYWDLSLTDGLAIESQSF